MNKKLMIMTLLSILINFQISSSQQERPQKSLQEALANKFVSQVIVNSYKKFEGLKAVDKGDGQQVNQQERPQNSLQAILVHKAVVQIVKGSYEKFEDEHPSWITMTNSSETDDSDDEYAEIFSEGSDSDCAELVVGNSSLTEDNIKRLSLEFEKRKISHKK